MDECKHGTNPDWCATCRALDDPSTSGAPGQPWGGETKQDVLNQICDQLGISRAQVGVGSSIPSEVFDVIKTRFAVGGNSMPEIAEGVAAAAGLPWQAAFDSRGTASGGGSTVTLPGLNQVLKAVAALQ